MDSRELEKLAGRWPGVGSDVKWEADLIFPVAGKVLCGLCPEGAGAGKLAFKLETERFLEFTDRPGFRPAPDMARAHWVALDDPRGVDRDALEVLLRRAYQLVRAKLPKKIQRELGD